MESSKNADRGNAAVTVIIPCYRCGTRIAHAVASVAAQTCRPAEIILVDDGSGDDTLPTLYALREQFGADWIRVIALEKNQGVSVARNAAWDQATQEFIAFLDADDIWHPQKIEIQYRWMRQHPNVIASGHAYLIIDPDADFPTARNLPAPQVSAVSAGKLLWSNPLVTPAVMLRRNIDYRFAPDKRYCEDYYLWLQIALDGHPMAWFTETLVWVRKRVGETGASRQLWQMRAGDINNYWRLWRQGKLDFARMSLAILYSLLKFLLLLLVGPKHHLEIKNWLEQRRFD